MEDRKRLSNVYGFLTYDLIAAQLLVPVIWWREKHSRHEKTRNDQLPQEGFCREELVQRNNDHLYQENGSDPVYELFSFSRRFWKPR